MGHNVKKLIQIPINVNIVLLNKTIIIKGNHGETKFSYSNCVTVQVYKNTIAIFRNNELKISKCYQKLTAALIRNKVFGVTFLFKQTLTAVGVGYKFKIEENFLLLNIGCSHKVSVKIPSFLTVNLTSATLICISGILKEFVEAFASQIRNMKPREPYKGKGILYEHEKTLSLKKGKTAKLAKSSKIGKSTKKK